MSFHVQRARRCARCATSQTRVCNGPFVLGVFGSMAEFGLELVRRGVRSGMAARARGGRIGRPRKFVDAGKGSRAESSLAHDCSVNPTGAAGL